jgi:hypothetical protein
VDPDEFEGFEEDRPPSAPRLAERKISTTTAKTAMPMDAMIAKPKSVKIIMGLKAGVVVVIGRDLAMDRWMEASSSGRL